MVYASVEMHYAYYHIPALLSSRFVIILKLISPYLSIQIGKAMRHIIYNTLA